MVCLSCKEVSRDGTTSERDDTPEMPFALPVVRNSNLQGAYKTLNVDYIEEFQAGCFTQRGDRQTPEILLGLHCRGGTR